MKLIARAKQIVLLQRRARRKPGPILSTSAQKTWYTSRFVRVDTCLELCDKANTGSRNKEPFGDMVDLLEGREPGAEAPRPDIMDLLEGPEPDPAAAAAEAPRPETTWEPPV